MNWTGYTAILPGPETVLNNNLMLLLLLPFLRTLSQFKPNWILIILIQKLLNVYRHVCE